MELFGPSYLCGLLEYAGNVLLLGFQSFACPDHLLSRRARLIPPELRFAPISERRWEQASVTRTGSNYPA